MARRVREEKTVNMQWLLTYADMITLMLTFFVMLLSMSSMEIGKVKQFAAATVGAMGVLREGQHSEFACKVLVSSEKRINEKVLEIEQFFKRFAGLKTHLLKEREQGNLEFEEKEEGLSIIMKEDLLFEPGRGEVRPEGVAMLREMGNAFRDFEGMIVVEGHTDSMPVTTGEFPSNWELSCVRAVTIVKYLTEQVGVDPRKLSAVGYGDTKPRVANDTPEDRGKNRRVEILLVPQIV
jgi:chemotaxis protein MotB